MIGLRHVVLSIALGAQPLAAQRPAMLVVTGDTAARATVVRERGYAAYPLTVLEALGARITTVEEPVRQRIEVRVLGVLLWFRSGEATFAANGFTQPLHHAAFERNGVLHVPEDFFVDWLPTRFPERVAYDARTATLATRAAIERAERRLAATPARPPAPFDEPSPPPQERPEPRRVPRPAAPVSSQMSMRLSASYFDNFFQAPSDGPVTNLLASSTEARLVLRIENPRANIYAQASGTAFDGFAPSLAVLGGFDWSGGRHSAEATAGYQQRNPRLPAGDLTGFTNIRHGRAAYGFVLPGNMQLSALGQYYDVALDTQAADHSSFGAGAALRYRGFGYRFSPEGGAMFSRWDAPAEAGDYDERILWVSLRAVPAAPLYVHVRYRRGVRSYLIDDPNASSFDREDARHHWTLAWDLRLSRRLAWGVYYTYEEVTSTRSERAFSTQAITSSISLRVW